MNPQAIQILRDVITEWVNKKQFTFEIKSGSSYISPVAQDEFVLRFSNSVEGFYCNGQLIPINLVSKPFHTSTISNNPISRNPNSDKYLLEKLLKEFDEIFYKEVEEKLENCIETLTTSDLKFF